MIDMRSKALATGLVVISTLCVLPYHVLAFGEPPDFSKKEPVQKKSALTPSKAVSTSTKNASVQASTTSNKTVLTEESVEEQRKKVDQFIQTKQFDKAKTALAVIPTKSATPKDIILGKKLIVFEQVDNDLKENSQLFRKDATSPETEKVTKRLYTGAQTAYLNGEDDLTKDLLIQTIFEDRSHFKAKRFLERAYGMAPGNYQIENIEAKYWKMSLVNLYSGYPDKAVKNLQALEMFDPENPTVFERMGSAYYSMGETRKAVQAWQRALFLNPDNKDLEKFIQNAQEEIKKQEQLAVEDAKSRSKKAQNSGSSEDMQLLRIVNDANTAYSYAQEVRKQMPGVNVVVEEAEGGKWAVKIPAQKKAESTEPSADKKIENPNQQRF